MAATVKPTAKTRLRPTAIGWMKPMATDPVSEKMSPPPNWANCGGMTPLAMMSLKAAPNES